MVRVGEQIPNFELQAVQKGDTVTLSLSDYRGGWLVLFFYPADFSYVCPTELEEVADNYGKFTELGAEVLSVSTDTVYTHRAWRGASEAIGRVGFPMVADPSGRLCRAFGTYIEEEGVSLRATFIVDPEGVLKAMEMHDNSIGRSVGETLRKLQASKFVFEHEGSLCPASWAPGMEPIIVKKPEGWA